MSALFWFIIGFLIGGTFGVVLLALLINADDTDYYD